jgi:putative phosphoribosyl transferase
MKVLSQIDAGRRLAQGVSLLVSGDLLVIAITPGGASVGAELARQLAAPLDIMTVMRLEVPGRPHSTFGAVGDGSTVLQPERIRELGLPEDYVAATTHLARAEVDRMTHLRRGAEPALPVQGRTVVLVDDGSSEAMLMVSAVIALRRALVARLVVAAPIIHAELDHALEGMAVERVRLESSDSTTQVRDPSFTQTTEFDIHDLVSQNRKSMPAVRIPATAI